MLRSSASRLVSPAALRIARRGGLFALALFVAFGSVQAQSVQGARGGLVAAPGPQVGTTQLAGLTAATRNGGSQALRVRIVQDDAAPGGTLMLAVDARTDGLAANTFGSATVDVGFDPALLSPSGAALGVLDYADSPYDLSPSVIGNGDVFRLTITSQNVGTGGFPDRDGYEVGGAYEPVATITFTITEAFDEADFPIDCESLSVGYYDSVDNDNGSGVILDNSTGAVPMTSVRPLALRTLALSAAEGWRTLSGLAGMSVDDLLGALSTRGFPGADDEDGFPNVWRWDEAAGWGAATSQSEELPVTDGVAFFALAADGGAAVRIGGAFADYDYSPGSPASCAAFPLAFDVSFTAGGSTGFEPGWNLEGNPTAGTLDWDASGWVKTGLANTIYVYDPVNGQYLTWNGTTGTLGDGLIAPLQGFWVKALVGASPALVAPEAALTTGGTFYGRSGSLAVADPEDGGALGEVGLERRNSPQGARGPVVALRIEGEVEGRERWAAAYVSFQPGGEAGLDRYDAEALAGLGDASLDLFTLLGDGTALEIDARPVASLVGGNETLEIPLAAEAVVDGAAVGGKFTLSLEEASWLPASVRPVLVDTETGAEVDLLSGRGYAFELAAPPSAQRIAAGVKDGAQDRLGGAQDRRESIGASSSGTLGGGGVDRTAPDTRLGTPTGASAGAFLGAPVARYGDARAARFLLRFEPAEGAARSASEAGKQGEADVAAASRGAGSSVPEAYALESVYPNPFAGRATVRYALPEAAEVRVAAYDLLGRRVAVLVEALRPAGYHTASWDAAGLPSGVYVLRFTAGEHAFTERITVVR